MLKAKLVCFRMHQIGNVKKDNMVIGKSFFVSIRITWVILSHLQIIHITLINVKRENHGAHLSLHI